MLDALFTMYENDVIPDICDRLNTSVFILDHFWCQSKQGNMLKFAYAVIYF